jgi:hypothetical protein
MRLRCENNFYDVFFDLPKNLNTGNGYNFVFVHCVWIRRIRMFWASRRGKDPRIQMRIRISTKMSRIRNTVKYAYYANSCDCDIFLFGRKFGSP